MPGVRSPKTLKLLSSLADHMKCGWCWTRWNKSFRERIRSRKASVWFAILQTVIQQLNLRATGAASMKLMVFTTNGSVQVTQGLQTGLQPLQIRFIPTWSSSFSAKKRKKKESRVGQPSSSHSLESLSRKVQGVCNQTWWEDSGTGMEWEGDPWQCG